MVPVLSMFLTCSHLFPEALAPSVTVLSERVDAIDEGAWTTFVCVDEDLVALNQRIDRRRQECE